VVWNTRSEEGIRRGHRGLFRNNANGLSPDSAVLPHPLGGDLYIHGPCCFSNPILCCARDRSCTLKWSALLVSNRIISGVWLVTNFYWNLNGVLLHQIFLMHEQSFGMLTVTDP
jgi:hypothetical protein